MTSHPIIQHEPLPETLRVVALRDPLVERHGFSMFSEYVETFWLPVVGPTTMWLLRRLAATASDEAQQVSTPALALSLGLADGLGRDAAMTRAVYRIERFSTGKFRGDLLQVRTHLAEVPQALMRRWPASLIAQHEHETKEVAHAAS